MDICLHFILIILPTIESVKECLYKANCEVDKYNKVKLSFDSPGGKDYLEWRNSNLDVKIDSLPDDLEYGKIDL